MSTYEQVESHSSYINNKRIITLLYVVDQLSLEASNRFHLNSINAYFNAIEQVFINIKDVIKDEDCREEIRKTRNTLFKIQFNIMTNENYRTEKMLYYMLFLTRKYNGLVISGLQDQKFFFRLSTVNKGLAGIGYYDTKVLTGEKIGKLER